MAGESPNANAATEVTLHETAPAAAPAPATERSLLDRALAARPSRPDAPTTDPELQRFHETDDPVEAVALWIKRAGGRPIQTADEALRRLNRDVARIDRLVTDQVNAILHHPRFQKLEASWRGLRYLVDQPGDEVGANVKIRVLDVGWRELVKDFDKAIEFDQSQLFKKVYSAEFGTSGGEPFSVLLGDYDIYPRPGEGHPTDDVEALRSLAQVAAAAFAPFIASAHPSLLGLDEFGELERDLDLERIQAQREFTKWRSFRSTPDAKFIGLTLPRMLLRRPYEDDGHRSDGFRYREADSELVQDEYLWGNACYAFGGLLLRTFEQTRWLADIRGVRRGEETAGLVTGLPTREFGTDSAGVSILGSTEVTIVDTVEDHLAGNGFIPLCGLQGSEYSAFFSTPSIHEPERFDRDAANENARLSAMMQYVLCVSRVAHYIKVIGREKIGSFSEVDECETFLNDWLEQYILRDDDATAEMKARYPLREANVQVREITGQPGQYACVIHLQPHYQLDDLSSGLKLTTRLHSSE